MSKKKLIAAGVLILVITSFYFLNIPFLFDSPGAKTEEQEPLSAIEESISTKIIEKLQEKYVGVDVKTTSNQELVIQVVGDEEYYNSVKRDMECIARSVIEKSVLKDYIVVFKRWDLIGHADEIINREHHLILQTLMKGLKNYYVVDHISSDTQQIITVHTSIIESDIKAHKVATDIEEKAKEILHSNELNSLSSIDLYKKIKIVNTNGIVIN